MGGGRWVQNPCSLVNFQSKPRARQLEQRSPKRYQFGFNPQNPVHKDGNQTECTSSLGSPTWENKDNPFSVSSLVICYRESDQTQRKIHENPSLIHPLSNSHSPRLTFYPAKVSDIISTASSHVFPGQSTLGSWALEVGRLGLKSTVKSYAPMIVQWEACRLSITDYEVFAHGGARFQQECKLSKCCEAMCRERERSESVGELNLEAILWMNQFEHCGSKHL